MHPDDPGIEEFEGLELFEADEDDDDWPQTDANVKEKWEALLRNDWRESEASALIPVEPGDDPTAIAAAQDVSPRLQSRLPPMYLAFLLLLSVGPPERGECRIRSRW